VKLLVYPPGEGNQNQVQLDRVDDGGFTGRGVLSGTVSQDYPSGTQIRVAADVWPGEYDIHVINISAQVAPIPTPTPTPTPTAAVQFNNHTLSNGSETVTIDSAQFGNQSVPGEEFVVVVHKTTQNTSKNSIGPKIGESNILSAGTHTNITVELASTPGVDPDASENIAELTNSQSLVATLYRANATNDDGVTHGSQITRDEAPVSSRAYITVTSTSSSSPQPVPLNLSVATSTSTSTVKIDPTDTTPTTVSFEVTNLGEIPRSAVVSISESSLPRGLTLEGVSGTDKSTELNQDQGQTKVIFTDISPGETVTATASVTPTPEATTDSVNGSIKATLLRNDTGPTVATVKATLTAQQEQDLVAEYAGEDGEIGPFDVIEAIDDFRQQQLGPFEVLEIIVALRD
jgi:hypothetical protein